jgi:hypothetical protein
LGTFLLLSLYVSPNAAGSEGGAVAAAATGGGVTSVVACATAIARSGARVPSATPVLMPLAIVVEKSMAQTSRASTLIRHRPPMPSIARMLAGSLELPLASASYLQLDQVTDHHSLSPPDAVVRREELWWRCVSKRVANSDTREFVGGSSFVGSNGVRRVTTGRR